MRKIFNAIATALQNTDSKRLTQFAIAAVAVTAVSLIGVNEVLAGAGAGADLLDDVATSLKDWCEGSVGKVIMVAIGLVGTATAVVRQSLMPFAVAVGGGIGIYNMPAVADNVFVAVLQ